MKRMVLAVLTTLLSAALFSPQAEAKTKPAAIPTEEFRLPNGLRVLLHVDRSDPIVSVAVMFHVGSSREKPGKTGFAHLFEHILFQESEHVGQDEFFRRIQEAGGTLNGGTWEDGTIYYEVVPKNALETVLWMESDRMGYLLGALTAPAFFNQQNVVMNEKRQSYDNRPYGYLWYVMNKMLYAPEHPYNWQVIGSMTDLAGASVEDARQFFTTWYGPNNATLVLAGDLDVKQAKALVEKYFGEIPSRPGVPAVTKTPGRVPTAQTTGAGTAEQPVPASSRVYYEDKLVKIPQLTMVWPTVPSFHEDEAALAYMAELLATNKRDVLYKRLVEEKKLTARVDVMPNVGELAGTLIIQAKPLPGVTLQQLEAEILAGLKEFSQAEVAADRLAGEKAKFETAFLSQMESVFYKAMVLAMMTTFHGGPEAIDKELARYRAVEAKHVKEVLARYILDRPYLALSIVPVGQPQLAADNSVAFVLPNDDSVRPKEPAADAKAPERTPSSFDRSKAPAAGSAPKLTVPKPYKQTFKNGVVLSGLEAKELPLVRFALVWRGGQQLDGATPGLAWLAGQLLKEGTQRLSPAEFQAALDQMGATLQVYVGTDTIELEVSCLKRMAPQVLALVSELVLSPRLDAVEFERLKAAQMTQLQQRQADAGNVATDILGALVFGPHNAASYPAMGKLEVVSGLTMEQVKAFYASFLGPDRLTVIVAGDVSQGQMKGYLKPLAAWKGRTQEAPQMPAAGMETGSVFVVDFPGAPQSELRVGTTGPQLADELFYPAQVMNYGLGGNFASVINMILREEKGYTYGMRSGFAGGLGWGGFSVFGSVQTSATGESIGIILDAIKQWQTEIPQAVIDFTRNALLYGMARDFETLSQRLNLVRRIAVYGLPADFVEQRQKTLASMTPGKAVELARQLLDVQKVVLLVVGDAAVVVPQLEALGVRAVKVLGK